MLGRFAAIGTILVLTVVLLSSQQPVGSRFLFVRAGDTDRADSDFLAVMDVTPKAPAYDLAEINDQGQIVRTGSAATGVTQDIDTIRPYSRFLTGACLGTNDVPAVGRLGEILAMCVGWRSSTV